MADEEASSRFNDISGWLVFILRENQNLRKYHSVWASLSDKQGQKLDFSKILSEDIHSSNFDNFVAFVV